MPRRTCTVETLLFCFGPAEPSAELVGTAHAFPGSGLQCPVPEHDSGWSLSKPGFCDRPRHIINASILAGVRVFEHVVRDEDDLILQGIWLKAEAYLPTDPKS